MIQLSLAESEPINELMADLGVSSIDETETFMLHDEGEVGDFLGIRIEKTAQHSFHLTQTGLINKVITAAGMDDCNTAITPATRTPLGTDKLGPAFNEKWKYSEIMGMLMFLATNFHPDIAYAVHQCARFTHCPRASHATAIKRILRYLKGTRYKGLFFNPTDDLKVDCYVDTDFAGLWEVEDNQDPLCVKSRSGYLLTFMGCPFSWMSKLQTQVALSTMEAKYIALSLAMRELIACQALLKEVYSFVLHGHKKASGKESNQVSYNIVSCTFGELPRSLAHEDNEAWLATMPRKSPRIKHIAIPYHFFWSQVGATKEIRVSRCH